MTRPAIVAVAIAASAALLEMSGAAQEAPRRDPRIEALVLDAARTAPEFEADGLLRIASWSAVDASWRRELLEDAFMRAFGAQQTYRRTALLVPPDSRQGAAVLAGDSRLTQVSLQARAVQMMALVDGARARELFQWIFPGLEATSCDDLLVPSIGEYYSTLSMLARTTYPESDRGEAARFLEYYLWRAHLPNEMPAVAEAILHFRPTSAEAAYFELVMRFIFEGALRDPRGFSVASLNLVTSVGELEDADLLLGVTGPFLARALRAYLRANMMGTRCADSSSELVAADTFNARIRRTGAAQDGVAALEGADTRATRTLRGATIDFYWRTSEARRLQQDFWKLRGPDRLPVPLSKRITPEWREQANRFVHDVERWSGAREATDRDYFYQKAVLLSEVINLIPAGRERVYALRVYIDFLRTADMERIRRTLWFAFATRLFEFARSSDRDFILDALDTSGHPVLSLYARLERFAPEQARPRPGTMSVGFGVAH